MNAQSQSYSKTAIAFHWVLAVLIIFQAVSAFFMSQDFFDRAFVFQMYQFHKSLGLTILVLSLARLFWRLAHKPPAYQTPLVRWEKIVSKTVHILFYVLMVGVPLAGWAMVSASTWGVPTIWFGLFEWPHLPILSTLENKKPVEEFFYETHEILAYAMMGLIGLHIGAALKHHFVQKDEVLIRMIPFLRKKNR
jgi:cytochrome b561